NVHPAVPGTRWELPMRRLLIGIGGLGVLLTAAALGRSIPFGPGEPAAAPGLRVQVEARNPWNHLKVNNKPDTFRFAIVTDRTGGVRPGVFERAVEQLNWLQPEFVVCVGDLIQGGTQDTQKVERQWREFDGFVGKLEMPFFYLPGNHDISNPVMDR